MTEACAPDQASEDAVTCWAERDEDERVRALGRFLAVTDQFEAARKLITKCFRRRTPEKDGKLIVLHGPSGSGKTTVADLVLEEVEESMQGIVSVGETAGDDEDEYDEDEAGGDDDDPIDLGPVGRLPRTAGIVVEGPNGKIRPIIKVFVEPRTRSIRLLRDIVRALGVNPKARSSHGELLEILKPQIEGQRVRMIMLDEIHHMVAGQGADVVKMLLVQMRIQVVGIGLPHSAAIVADNEDLERHVRSICPMTAFALDLSDTSQWRAFLASLSEAMPFDVKPDFTEVGTALRLHVASRGLVGRLMNLVEVATELAVDDGLTTVEAYTLDRAFRQIHDVGSLETPFGMKECSEEAFEPIRKEIAKRARIAARAKAPGKTRRGDPDFQKGRR